MALILFSLSFHDDDRKQIYYILFIFKFIFLICFHRCDFVFIHSISTNANFHHTHKHVRTIDKYEKKNDNLKQKNI